MYSESSFATKYKAHTRNSHALASTLRFKLARLGLAAGMRRGKGRGVCGSVEGGAGKNTQQRGRGGGVLLPTASTISIPTRNPILIGGAGALLKGGSLGRGLRSGKQGFVLVGNSKPLRPGPRRIMMTK